jgi:hypothetical protein
MSFRARRAQAVKLQVFAMRSMASGGRSTVPICMRRSRHFWKRTNWRSRTSVRESSHRM